MLSEAETGETTGHNPVIPSEAGADATLSGGTLHFRPPNHPLGKDVIPSKSCAEKPCDGWVFVGELGHLTRCVGGVLVEPC
jgi:hypothetical protein